MTTTQYSDQQMAQQLAQYLTNRERYGGKSPLEERVQVEISAMARTIAEEIVAGHPELREVISQQVRSVIAQCLRDDAYLSETVLKAVAKALQRYTLTGEDD